VTRNGLDIDFWRILNALTLIRAAQPHLRVGQILVNAAGADPFYRTDADLADALEAYLSDNRTNK
jgi:hypothetical protein